MKISILGISVLAGAFFLQSCSIQVVVKNDLPLQEEVKMIAKEHQHDHGISIEFMDKSVRPQDDFYNYVNGGWMKTAVIPADKSSWGSFNELGEKTDENSLTILKNILTEKYEKGTEGQKIQDLYATYMDMDKRNADGINPIKGDLAKIDAIKNMEDLQKYLIESVKEGNDPLFSWSVRGDLKNSKMNAVYLISASLGLGKDYYQKENEENRKTLEEYTKYVAFLLEIIGEKNATEKAQRVVALEKVLLKLTLLMKKDGMLISVILPKLWKN